MNTFKALAKQRYSCRRFSSRMIEAETLTEILEASLLAPTAVNYQPQKIYVIQSAKQLEKIRALTKMTFQAPVVMLVCYDERESWKSFDNHHDVGEMDVSIVGTHMMLAAAELGIGSLWARAYDTKAISEAFALPEYMKLSFILSLGYPDETSKPSDKHEISKTIEETTIYL